MDTNIHMTTLIVSNNRRPNTKTDKGEQFFRQRWTSDSLSSGQNSVVEHKGMWLVVTEEQIQILVVLRFNVCYMYACLSHE